MTKKHDHTVIHKTTLWRGREDATEPDMSVRLEHGKITEITASSEIVIPEDAQVVDGTGTTTTPGLCDVHVHLTTNSDFNHVVDNATYRGLVPGSEKLLHGIRNGLRALTCGVTTLRVMGHRESGDVQLADFIERGLLPGPRLLVAPWVMSMTGGRGDLFYPAELPRQEFDTADGVEECRKVVRLQRKLGAHFIKLTASAGLLSAGDKVHWSNYTVEEMKAIVQEAHDYDLKVAAHAHATKGIKRALEAGVDTLEHGSFLDDECIEMMQKQGTFLVPTLLIVDWIARNGAKTGVRADGLEKLEAARQLQRASIEKAIDAGVKIAMGTDSSGTLCPFGNHGREIELYVELGMSPAAALASATSVAAEALGMEDQIGMLDVGKDADIVVFRENPLEDISVLTRDGAIQAVFKSGIDVTNPWPAVWL
ncbi:MAG: amidohydrolase family protein [Pseudomonadota bacterium]